MSGIYIPGLSMPRKTGIVSIVLSGDGSALLCEDGAYSEIKAIPVPEHGRCIDADGMVESLANLLKFPSNLVNGQWIVNTIREQPTIIPADKEGEG